MVGPPPAVAALRVAVRRWLAAHHATGRDLTVAVSGGADSLALCSAVLFESRGRFAVHGRTVDHQLQPGSGQRAAAVRDWMTDAGCASALALPVEVGRAGGLEAAARDARYAALEAARRGDVLLGHTLDDQAETVLLGLGRGSGRRSLQGMAAYAAPWGRPLLQVRRALTRQYCAELDLPVWDDPHNSDRRFTRVRLREEALPLLEDILDGGVAEALARTAAQLQDADPTADAAVLLSLLGAERPQTAPLAACTPATRRAVLKLWLDTRLRAAGAARGTGPVPATTAAHVAAVDALVAEYHGQGPVYLPGGTRVVRQRGRLEHVPADVSGRAAPALPIGEDSPGVRGRD